MADFSCLRLQLRLSWHISGWETSTFELQNSLTGMFWVYSLQFQFLQQWSPVAREISCASCVTSTFPNNCSSLGILGKNFRKSLKIHSLFKNWTVCIWLSPGDLFCCLVFVRLWGTVCKSPMDLQPDPGKSLFTTNSLEQPLPPHHHIMLLLSIALLGA